MLGTSTSLRVSAGRASRFGQEVRGRSRAAPQAGEVGVGRARPIAQQVTPGAGSPGTW